MENKTTKIELLTNHLNSLTWEAKEAMYADDHAMTFLVEKLGSERWCDHEIDTSNIIQGPDYVVETLLGADDRKTRMRVHDFLCVDIAYTRDKVPNEVASWEFDDSTYPIDLSKNETYKKIIQGMSEPEIKEAKLACQFEVDGDTVLVDISNCRAIKRLDVDALEAAMLANI